MKKTLVVAALVFSVIWSMGFAWAQTHTLNVNTALVPGDPMHTGLLKFKEGVESATKGRVGVKIFVGSGLGKDEDVLEQARAGANVAVLVDGGRLAVFVRELGILGAPYITRDYKEARKLVTSPLFAEWSQKLRAASKHQILSFNWWQGERHLLTNKPVKVPADLKGIRMRTPGAPMWMETVRAMGATPTPMGWVEVYPALQQKVIDAVEAQHPATFGARLYEVIKYVTKTGHINLMTGLVTGTAWFDSLPEDLRKIVVEQALAAGDYATELNAKLMVDFEAKMKEKGMVISEIDKDPFIKATAEVYTKLGYAELRETVQKYLQK